MNVLDYDGYRSLSIALYLPAVSSNAMSLMSLGMEVRRSGVPSKLEDSPMSVRITGKYLGARKK